MFKLPAIYVGLWWLTISSNIDRWLSSASMALFACNPYFFKKFSSSVIVMSNRGFPRPNNTPSGILAIAVKVLLCAFLLPTFWSTLCSRIVSCYLIYILRLFFMIKNYGLTSVSLYDFGTTKIYYRNITGRGAVEVVFYMSGSSTVVSSMP